MERSLPRTAFQTEDNWELVFFHFCWIGTASYNFGLINTVSVILFKREEKEFPSEALAVARQEDTGPWLIVLPKSVHVTQGPRSGQWREPAVRVIVFPPSVHFPLGLHTLRHFNGPRCLSLNATTLSWFVCGDPINCSTKNRLYRDFINPLLWNITHVQKAV